MNLDDALEANDLVTEVFRKYHQIIIKNRPKYANACLISTQNSAANGSAANRNGQNGTNNTNKNTMDELHEIFASTSNTNATHSNGRSVMTTLTPLEPTTLAATKVKSNGNFAFHFQRVYSFVALDITLINVFYLFCTEEASSNKSWQAIKDLNNAASSLESLITSPINLPSTTTSIQSLPLAHTFENILNNGRCSIITKKQK